MERRVVVRVGFAAGLEGTAVPFEHRAGVWVAKIHHLKDIPDADVKTGDVDRLYYEADELDFLED